MRFPSGWVGEQNVLWFEVPMDDAFRLQDPHGARYLLQENSNRVLAQRAFCCEGENVKQHR